MGVQDDAERFEPATVEEWSEWLATHHADTPGVWLVTPKASSGRRTFDYEQAILEALRYGWVDSTQRTLDDERTMMWYAPRRRGSVWTRNNKQRVARLEAEGRMEPAGSAAVATAKDSGMWTVMDEVEDLVVPDDLSEAFDRYDGGRDHWDRFPPSARKQMLGWVALAKRPATRHDRIERIASLAARGERAL